jgi:hypothetical protein
MSGLAHSSIVTKRIVNPGIVPKAGRCGGRVGLGMPWERRCSNTVHFLVPETQRCSIHLSPIGLALLAYRADLWVEWIQEVYEDVIASPGPDA